MPKILSPFIHEQLPGLWFEGPAYEKKQIYSIEPGKMPPVNYDVHILKSHSLTHVETSLHTQKNGMTVGDAYAKAQKSFFGNVLILRLKGDFYTLVDADKKIFHWIVSLDQLVSEIKPFENCLKKVQKVFITTDSHKTTSDGFHDPNYVLTLSQEAADYLVNEFKIDLFGTSWKSSDYNPGKSDRPIHNTLFKTAIIVECLDLRGITEGIYFLVCAPLPISNASESPVVPIIFSQNELQNYF